MKLDSELPELLYPGEPNRFTPAHLEPLLEFCVKQQASDVIFQSGENVLVEIFGRLHKITHRKLTNTEVGDLLNAMYGPNGTTQILSGVDVDTHYEIRPTRSDRFRFRVNGTGCQVEGHAAIQITMRAIPNEPPKLSDLGLPDKIVEAIAPRDGVVYVTGATGSGKSTLLAAIIRSIAEDPLSNRKILTYEAPIEFVFDAIEKPSSVIAQSEIPRNLPTFAAGVRNALRRTPKLILVGESRDVETMSAVLEAALTGHPVYTTLHANGVAETIRRLVGTFPKEERHGRSIDIIETLRLIIWQQLAPTVDGKRIALREYLVFDEDVRDQLLSVDPDQATAVTRRLVKERGQPMIVDAEKAFNEGKISERTFRILSAGHRSADKDASA